LAAFFLDTVVELCLGHLQTAAAAAAAE